MSMDLGAHRKVNCIGSLPNKHSQKKCLKDCSIFDKWANQRVWQPSHSIAPTGLFTQSFADNLPPTFQLSHKFGILANHMFAASAKSWFLFWPLFVSIFIFDCFASYSNDMVARFAVLENTQLLSKKH